MTNSSIFSAAIKAVNSQDNTNVYILTPEPARVASEFEGFLLPYGEEVNLVSHTDHVFFYNFGGQKDLFICEKAQEKLVTQVFIAE